MQIGAFATLRPSAALLAATSLTVLKPKFKRRLFPVTAFLAQAGVTANQVTAASLAGSISVGALLCLFPSHPALFAVLPVWLLVRMACATIDGTLAIDFGQKSRLGGILNEAGDIISDIVLFLPLALVPPFSLASVVLLISLIVLCELAGIVGALPGSVRGLEGPLGKADRSIALAILSVPVAIFGRLPESAIVVVPLLTTGLILTIWNRSGFRASDRSEIGDARSV
jgi:CDP-diacylglycerol--glycerol-3-phosphate 3-phosphatidyltransferase